MRLRLAAPIPALCLAIALMLLGACAMQRAKDSEAAQAHMVGMSGEQVFSCMGIPLRKATHGALEVWQFKSGNESTEKTKTGTKLTGAKDMGDDVFLDALGASLYAEDEVKEKRYCLIHVVLKNDRVEAVRYSGPSGGFLTDNEQCAYAIRNCLPPGP